MNSPVGPMTTAMGDNNISIIIAMKTMLTNFFLTYKKRIILTLLKTFAY